MQTRNLMKSLRVKDNNKTMAFVYEFLLSKNLDFKFKNLNFLL